MPHFRTRIRTPAQATMFAASPPPARPAAMLVAVIGLVMAGVAIGWWGLSGGSASIDREILLAFRHPGDLATGVGPQGTPWLIWLVSFLGSQLVLAILSLIVAGRIYAAGDRRLALAALLGVTGAMLLATALKLAIMRPRPDIVPHLGAFAGSSFPSSHAMLGMAVYGVLALSLARMRHGVAARRWLFALAVALALVIGVTRLYLGVHWPTDVLAGWCLGAAWMLAYAALLPWALRRDHAPPQVVG